jgi:hypothetical protein
LHTFDVDGHKWGKYRDKMVMDGNLPDEGKPFGLSVLGYIHKQALR